MRRIMRRSYALRLLGYASSSHPSRRQPSNHRRVFFNNRSHTSSPPARSGSAADAPSLPRRRRRRPAGKSPAAAASDDDRTTAVGQRFVPGGDPAFSSGDDVWTAFSPKDSSGAPLDAPGYLALASLSPWVPCPDLVAKRVLEIADASSDDVHADLGCGDGRLNFAAAGGPFHVKESWGVDVDENILERCRERLGRRFVPSAFGVDGGERASSEAERLEFVQADLVAVMEKQREKHQRRQGGSRAEMSPASTQRDEDASSRDWSREDDIAENLSRSTVVTMYFVDDALRQLKPFLASALGGRDGVRVVTVGYEMKGWDAAWVERVLGLTIFKYDMKDVSDDPPEWRVDGERREGEETTAGASVGLDGEYDDSDDEAVAEYLRQKLDRDTRELNEGLTVHHDEALDDFAQFRSKQQSAGGGDAAKEQEWELEEEGWDFDETEDPEALMREAQRAMAEAGAGGRGKSLMAGLDDVGGKGRKKGTMGKKKKKPVWKKP